MNAIGRRRKGGRAGTLHAMFGCFAGTRPTWCLAAALVASFALQAAARTPPAPPTTEPRSAVVQDRHPGHLVDAGAERPRHQPPPRPATRLPPGTPSSHTGCGWEALRAKRGDAFVAHVYTLTYECFSALFGGLSNDIRVVLFQEANMIAVARAAGRNASAYDGIDDAAVVSTFQFLHAGLYVGYYELEDALNWGPEVWVAIHAAVRSAFANPHANDVSDSAGRALRTVITVADAPDQRLRYLPTVVDWLSEWNVQRSQFYEQQNVAGAVFLLIYNCHFEDGFEAAVQDLPIVDVLRDMALSDWMLGTDAEWLLSNGARELARFLSYPELPFHDAVRRAVQEVLDRYDPTGDGAGAWIAAIGSVLYVGECEAFGVCGQVERLEGVVLSVEHRCSDEILIRGQDLDARQFQAACATLRRQEAIFHHRLQTRRQPVADDFTAAYEVVAFADWDNYDTYSYLFFGNDTNNGGIFFEGEPSQPGNVARHLGYVATWLPDDPIWNLGHEYVHYLDGRFNLWGAFRDARVDTHKTVWWIEGLAEYLSKRDDNEDAVVLAQSTPLALETVVATTYDDDVDRVYRWSYLLVRLLFERHPAQIDQLLGFLRAGDFDGYLRHVNSGFEGVNDATWRGWLGDVEVLEDYDLATLRLTLPEALSTFDDEAGQAIIDVVDAHRTGQGITLAAVSSDPAVATVRVDGGRLTITAVSVGDATIRVTLSDAWGSVERRLNLAVTADCPSWLCRAGAAWKRAVAVPGAD